MTVISVNVGRLRDLTWHGRAVTTSIFKSPVPGPVAIRTLNLDGDEQSDLTVHGGVDKAVYAYPSEHYGPWGEELPGADLAWGAFGENLTVAGLLESDVRVGDRLRVGSAELAVTQPRMPCYKLGVRFDRLDMVKRFLASGRSGFYLRVLQEGEVEAGAAITLLARDDAALSIAQVAALYSADDADPALLARASVEAGLPEDWREYFRTRLPSA
ncbi:MAG: MOSC domain-containing protein [Vicinamibacterales bacterium]